MALVCVYGTGECVFCPGCDAEGRCARCGRVIPQGKRYFRLPEGEICAGCMARGDADAGDSCRRCGRELYPGDAVYRYGAAVYCTPCTDAFSSIKGYL